MREVSKDVIKTLLEEELTDHLGFEQYDQKAKTIDNSRNGYTPKTTKSKYGEIGLDVPRDRKSEFEPQVLKKRKKEISGLEDKIISLYAKGLRLIYEAATEEEEATALEEFAENGTNATRTFPSTGRRTGERSPHSSNIHPRCTP